MSKFTDFVDPKGLGNYIATIKKGKGIENFCPLGLLIYCSTIFNNAFFDSDLCLELINITDWNEVVKFVLKNR